MTKLKNPTDSSESLAAGFQNKLSANNSTKAHTVKPGTKTYGVLYALAQGYSFNRFQAERELSDHCLPSTISALQGKGISIHREMEKVLCLGGTATTEVADIGYCLPKLQKQRNCLDWITQRLWHECARSNTCQ